MLETSPLAIDHSCSTPVGVMDRFTGDGQSVVPGITSAQRLSASWIVSLALSKDGANASIGCSTPVGVMDRFTYSITPPKTRLGLCSTPVGVMDRFTQCISPCGARLTTCSTPVGVMDRFTFPACAPAPSASRAQRLSASWIVSQLRQNRLQLFDEVLNACRRHGSFHAPDAAANDKIKMCSTPVGVMDRFTSPCTWRQSKSHARAQRLSASWIVSQLRQNRLQLFDDVLNACRRHGSFHAPDAAANDKIKMCSTPVGVMDRFTSPCTWRQSKSHARAQRLSASWIVSHLPHSHSVPRTLVLNACRRHGSFHMGAGKVVDGWFVCSTPVGVMDRFTHAGLVAESERKMCSTPVGVMDRFTSPLPAARRPYTQVLNACRRHGSFHSPRLARRGY